MEPAATMSGYAKLSAIVLLALYPACSDPVSCDGMARWSFRVHVSDGATGTPICDADVVASDGTTQFTLPAHGTSDCVYLGPAEQPGTFTVSVTKAGYEPAGTTIVARRGECGVITQDATVKLTAVP